MLMMKAGNRVDVIDHRSVLEVALGKMSNEKAYCVFDAW